MLLDDSFVVLCIVVTLVIIFVFAISWESAWEHNIATGLIFVFVTINDVSRERVRNNILQQGWSLFSFYDQRGKSPDLFQSWFQFPHFSPEKEKQILVIHNSTTS
jgi:hypothetical protein